MDNKKVFLIKQIFDNREAVAAIKASKTTQESLTAAVFKGNAAFEAFKQTISLSINVAKGFKDVTIETSKALYNLGERGGKVQDVQAGFQRNFKNSTEALQDLRKAANGTISDYDLMLASSKAAMLGVSSDSKELARLMTISSGRAQALGISTTQAFEDIVTGIGRNSPLILDNLGITTQAYKEQVEAIEATGRVLSDSEKKQILLNTVMQDSVSPVITATDAYEQFRVKLENSRDALALKLAPVVQEVSERVFPLMDMAVEKSQKAFTDWYENNQVFILDQLARIKEGSLLVKDQFLELVGSTQSSKTSFEDLANNGVKKTVDLLVGEDGDGGLFGATTKVLDLMDDKETIDNAKAAWESFSYVLENVVNSFKWIVENASNIKTSIEVATNVATGGLPTISKKLFGSGSGEPTPRSSVLDKLSGRAIGGSASGFTWVGESGPEIVKLPQGSQVYNADQSSKMKGGMEVTINIQNVSSQAMVDDIINKIQDLQDRQNRLGGYSLV